MNQQFYSDGENSLKKGIGYLLLAIVIVSAIGVIYYVFRGYFMIKVGQEAYFDGWGRQLYDTPAWIKIIWSDFQFPGYKWFFIDFIGFWVYAMVCAGLVKLSSYLREEE